MLALIVRVLFWALVLRLSCGSGWQHSGSQMA